MSPMVHPTGQLGWHAPIYVATAAPTMAALAAIPTPAVLVVVGGMLPPPMQAAAVLLLPSVSVTMPPIMVPLLTATAGMPAPSIRVDSPVTSTLLTAVAQFLAPVIGKGITVPAAIMAAVGAMPTPTVTVGINAPITAPLLTANAALLTPTVSAGVSLTAPLLQSTAAMLTPSIGAGKGVTAPLMLATAAMPAPTVTITPAGPSFDAIGAGVVSLSSTTASENHTAAAGAAVLAFAANSAGIAPTSVSYGGTAMTQLTTVTDGISAIHTLYKLTGAPAGTKTVTATYAGSNNTALQTISFTGVTTVGTPSTTGAGGAFSQALTCSANQIIVQSFEAMADLAFGSGYGMSSYSGGTSRSGIKDANNYYVLTVSTATTNTTFTASSPTGSYWAGIGVVLS